MSPERSERRVVSLADYVVPSPSFAQAISITHPTALLFVSGITARGTDGSIVGEGDVVLQARTIFEHLRRLLRAAGGDLNDVVKTTTYVRSAADIPRVGAVRLEYFEGSPPASTSVEVSSLFDPRQLVEIDAIAAVGTAPGSG